MHAEGCCRCAPRNDAPLPRLRRIFAGTPEQMYVSLNEKLATLPHDTQVLVPAWGLTLPNPTLCWRLLGGAVRTPRTRGARASAI